MENTLSELAQIARTEGLRMGRELADGWQCQGETPDTEYEIVDDEDRRDGVVANDESTHDYSHAVETIKELGLSVTEELLDLYFAAYVAAFNRSYRKRIVVHHRRVLAKRTIATALVADAAKAVRGLGEYDRVRMAVLGCMQDIRRPDEP